MERRRWPVRIVAMVASSLAGFGLTAALYPVLHQKTVSPVAGGFAALVGESNVDP